MDSRAKARETFLQDAGWGGAAVQPLAGDASTRRYERLKRGDRSAVLMNAPPASDQMIVAFCRIAGHLRAIGLNAPRIMAQNSQQGFILLQDFGDAVFARFIAQKPLLELELYEAAVDVLVHLHAQP
ncbi:MAG: phosphotransferase, partial [Halocynthiibacter sp.]